MIISSLKPHQQSMITQLYEKLVSYNNIDVETIIENNICRKCSHDKLVKNGQSKGIKRFKCKKCGSTQSNTANTPLYGLKLKDKWVDYVQLILSETTPLTLQQISDKLDINIKTAHSWRHRFLSSLNEVKPLEMDNEIEMDDVFLKFRVKGRIGKEKFIKYDYNDQSKNIPNQIRIDEINKKDHNSIWLCIHNRMGDFDFIPLKVQKKGHVGHEDILEQTKNLNLDGLTIITDSNRSLGKYLSKKGVKSHLKFKSSDTQIGVIVNKGVHNNNINNVMSLLQNWMKVFRGYSTKYEWNYLKWFRFHRMFQQRRLDTENVVKLSVDDKGSSTRYGDIIKYYGDFIAA